MNQIINIQQEQQELAYRDLMLALQKYGYRALYTRPICQCFWHESDLECLVTGDDIDDYEPQRPQYIVYFPATDMAPGVHIDQEPDGRRAKHDYITTRQFLRRETKEHADEKMV